MSPPFGATALDRRVPVMGLATQGLVTGGGETETRLDRAFLSGGTFSEKYWRICVARTLAVSLSRYCASRGEMPVFHGVGRAWQRGGYDLGSELLALRRIVKYTISLEATPVLEVLT
jgi:hypothetical protein